MGKTDSDQTTSGRQRRLNVIYFVDSARTRSFSLPVGGLNVVLVLGLALVTWSIASVGLIAWLGQDRLDVATRLKASLAAVFDYETRYDGVYEVAYPNGSHTAKRVAASERAPAATPAASAGTRRDKADGTSPVAAAASGAAPAVEVALKDKTSGDGMGMAAKAALLTATPRVVAATGTGKESTISVSNPVVEAHAEALELRFDLTNKSDDRAEGYVWAIAEFKADGGSATDAPQFFGAPPEIGLRGNGEPANPERSAIFGIRHFKKKSFSFPLSKGQAGVFTGLKIGVMDRTGTNRMIYNVPIQVRVGAGVGKDDAPKPPGTGPQSG